MGVTELPAALKTQAHTLSHEVGVVEIKFGTQRSGERSCLHGEQVGIDVQVDLIARSQHATPVEQRVTAGNTPIARELAAEGDAEFGYHRELILREFAAVGALGEDTAVMRRGDARLGDRGTAVDRNHAVVVTDSNFGQTFDGPSPMSTLQQHADLGTVELVLRLEVVLDKEGTGAGWIQRNQILADRNGIIEAEEAVTCVLRDAYIVGEEAYS